MSVQISEVINSVQGNTTTKIALQTIWGALNAELDAIKVLLHDMRTHMREDELLSYVGLGIGTTPQNAATLAVYFRIGGQEYYKAAVAAGTALAGVNIPQSKYGAWRLEIGINGTIDIVPATNNATGQDSAAAAVLDLPVLSSAHASLGVVTAMKSDAVFDPGTTALDAANTTVAYTDGTMSNYDISAEVTDQITD